MQSKTGIHVPFHLAKTWFDRSKESAIFLEIGGAGCTDQTSAASRVSMAANFTIAVRTAVQVVPPRGRPSENGSWRVAWGLHLVEKHEGAFLEWTPPTGSESNWCGLRGQWSMCVTESGSVTTWATAMDRTDRSSARGMHAADLNVH